MKSRTQKWNDHKARWTFDHTKHIQMWTELIKHWESVRKFGLNDVKLLVRHTILHDYTDILNNCYACAYAVGGHNNDSPSRCLKCPLEMEPCNSDTSPFRQLVKATINNDGEEYKRLCQVMISLKVKEGVKCV